MHDNFCDKGVAGRQKLFELLRQNSVFDDGSDVLQSARVPLRPDTNMPCQRDPAPFLAGMSTADTFEFSKAPPDTIASLYGFDV